MIIVISASVYMLRFNFIEKEEGLGGGGLLFVLFWVMMLKKYN